MSADAGIDQVPIWCDTYRQIHGPLMQNYQIRYALYSQALPPRPIKMNPNGWGGKPERMADGAEGQPWHCLPFTEAATHGLELLYPYETPCEVVNEGGSVRFEWDYSREPGGGPTGGEFRLFTPQRAAKFYLFNTRIDLQPPPGFVIRTTPHPRYFTDETGTVPLAITGHLQNQWYPRLLFVVFRSPPPGGRHIFRKDEPFAQVLLVPGEVTYDLQPMTADESTRRRQLEADIDLTRNEIGDRSWVNSDGNRNNNHYKVLSRAFTRGGFAGVEEVVAEAKQRTAGLLGRDKPIAEAVALAEQYIRERKFELAEQVLREVLQLQPTNVPALTHLAVCITLQGNVAGGDSYFRRAAELAPQSPKLHYLWGECLLAVRRFAEAELVLRRGIEADQESGSMHSLLAVVIAKQRRFEEAERWIALARQLDPRGLITLYRFAQICREAGKPSELRTILETILSIDPNAIPARDALRDLDAPANPG